MSVESLICIIVTSRAYLLYSTYNNKDLQEYLFRKIILSSSFLLFVKLKILPFVHLFVFLKRVDIVLQTSSNLGPTYIHDVVHSYIIQLGRFPKGI